MEVTELRIHGASGITAEEMLGGPATLVAGDERAGFYRPRGRENDPSLEAFAWGGLTSGRARQALWLLLLPFALVNVAGWMGPTASGPRRVQVVLTRLIALGTTSILVMMLATVGLDLVAHRGVGPVEWLPRGLRFAVASILILSLIGFLSWLRTRTTAPPTGPPTVGDKLGDARISDRGMLLWESPSITNLLDDLHTGFAVSLVAWLLTEVTQTRWLGLVVGAQIGVVIVLILVMSSRPRSSFTIGLVTHVRWWKWVCLPATVIAVGLVTPLDGTTSTTPLEATSLGMLVTVGTLVILSGFLFVVSGSLFRTKGAGPLTAAVLGIGSGLGTGGGFLLVLFGNDISAGGRAALEWLAVIFFFTALVALAVFTVPMLVGGAHRPWRALSRSVRRMPAALWALGVVPVVSAAVVLVMILVDDGSPLVGLGVGIPEVPESRWGWLLPFVALIPAALAAIRHLDRWRRWSGVIAMIAVVAAVVFDASYKTVAVAATLVVPAAVIAFVGLRAPDERLRRTVGIVWDLLTLFPGWVHPWAPPSYGQSALPLLDARLGVLTEQRPVVIAAHSQGTVIAAAGLFLSTPVGLALLTYGSPLHNFYTWLFPYQFGGDTFSNLFHLVRGLWRNLWRETDPLSAPVFANQDVDVLVEDPQPGEEWVRVHSGYETTIEYEEVLTGLVLALDGSHGEAGDELVEEEVEGKGDGNRHDHRPTL